MQGVDLAIAVFAKNSVGMRRCHGRECELVGLVVVTGRKLIGRDCTTYIDYNSLITMDRPKSPKPEELAFPEYWNSRYAAEPAGTFDWFRDPSSLSPFLHRHLLSKESRILHLGCGNSVLFPHFLLPRTPYLAR